MRQSVQGTRPVSINKGVNGVREWESFAAN
jgi:hypothetical protein